MAKMIGALLVATAILSTTAADARDKVQTMLTLPFAEKSEESATVSGRRDAGSDEQGRRQLSPDAVFLDVVYSCERCRRDSTGGRAIWRKN